MQLDRTQIAVRERGLLEILDLSLHVVCRHAAPLLVTLLIGAAPLMLLNHLLVGWMMAQVDFELALAAEDFGAVFRYLSSMTMLVIVEAQLMSVFATSYLGQAAFLERPGLGEILVDVARMGARLAWCQVMLRGVAPALLLMLTLDRGAPFQPLVEVVLLPSVVIYAALVRSLRPFMNEIILLEKNPLRAEHTGKLTIGRRSFLLHSPSSGDLFLRWWGCAGVAALLAMSVFGLFLFCSGALLNDWSLGRVMIQFCLPLSLWMVAGFVAVVRFLCYLDLRIRHEGWEVELRLRAEAARLANQYAGLLT